MGSPKTPPPLCNIVINWPDPVNVIYGRPLTCVHKRVVVVVIIVIIVVIVVIVVVDVVVVVFFSNDHMDGLAFCK